MRGRRRRAVKTKGEIRVILPADLYLTLEQMFLGPSFIEERKRRCCCSYCIQAAKFLPHGSACPVKFTQRAASAAQWRVSAPLNWRMVNGEYIMAKEMLQMGLGIVPGLGI